PSSWRQDERSPRDPDFFDGPVCSRAAPSACSTGAEFAIDRARSAGTRTKRCQESKIRYTRWRVSAETWHSSTRRRLSTTRYSWGVLATAGTASPRRVSPVHGGVRRCRRRSEEHTQNTRHGSITYGAFCLKNK